MGRSELAVGGIATFLAGGMLAQNDYETWVVLVLVGWMACATLMVVSEVE